MIRVGQGFDLHRLEPGRPFLLGGIQLDWPKGPLGHSDGDVLLHALIDALLGASGLGDIGEWFPPTDAAYAGAQSIKLLQQVCERLSQEGWQVENLDSTILLEAPKLSPYKTRIRDNLAAHLGITANRISVKAKTMEGLGPVGQQEAVAAMVNVLLQKTG